MINNGTSGYKPQEVISLRPGKTYRHSLALKQWILRKEQSFKIVETKMTNKTKSIF